MAGSLLEVAALPDPSARSSARAGGPTAWRSRQVRVPLGVIFMIYESRPNVTVDAAALCVKSGNAVILRGGKEAIHSNRALHRILADELQPAAFPSTPSSSSPTTDRAAVGAPAGTARVHRPGHPPRRRKPDPPGRRRGADAGPEALSRATATSTSMPRADLDMAIRIILNAKVQRPGVCNAAETLLVHRAIAAELPAQGRRRPRWPRGSSSAAIDRAAGRSSRHDPRRASRLGHRVPRQDPGRRGRRLDRRGDRPHHRATARGTPRRS